MSASFETCWDCPACGSAQPFDRPVCTDGHGDDCPERICAGCAAAFVLDPPRTVQRSATVRRAARAA